MAPPVGEIYFLFHTNNAKFPPLSHAKKNPEKIQKKFPVDLKNDL